MNFERLVMEAIADEDEYTITYWCPFFTKLPPKLQEKVTGTFKFYCDLVTKRGIKDTFYTDSKYDKGVQNATAEIRHSEERGPELVFSNIVCQSRKMTFDLENILHKIHTAIHRNLYQGGIERYVYNTFSRYGILKNEITSKREEMIKELPELEGIF